MRICENCNKGFKLRVTIDGKIRILAKRKYCLDCSPFNKHNTRKLNPDVPFEEMVRTKFCNKCQLNLKRGEFYTRRKGVGLSPYCIKCTKEDALSRQRNLKKLAVEYKGGKCNKCGYCKCINALDFHHLDESVKNFSISHCHLTTFEKVKSELDKCILLCSNCHRELHAIENGTLTVSGI